MGLESADHSEDDTSYTDCNSHISSSSPNVERRDEDTEPAAGRGTKNVKSGETGAADSNGKCRNLKLPQIHHRGQFPSR